MRLLAIGANPYKTLKTKSGESSVFEKFLKELGRHPENRSRSWKLADSEACQLAQEMASLWDGVTQIQVECNMAWLHCDKKTFMQLSASGIQWGWQTETGCKQKGYSDYMVDIL